MRMWLVDPKAMCRRHLQGEHLELHMLAGCLEKGKNIKGFIEKGFIDPILLIRRHDQLVGEMKRRGYNHCSHIDKLPKILEKGHIDPEANRIELYRRCDECREGQF
ncbi:MAG: pyrimidine dimer DNA glycosylase/endonuclease V [Dehalococcoidales bacterium]|nr:pyrimidine dimer DNA glycosylase/endonuclease V [Dehalococcoidales bacterium]